MEKIAEKRNMGLDCLKAIGCLCVVVGHVTGIVATADGGYTLNHFLYYIACLGLPTFFMVNGNLLLNRPPLTYRYAAKKIPRILLIIFSWNVILFLAKFVIENKLINPIFVSLENLIGIGHFTVFWFFGSLIIIYLLLPVISRLFCNIKAAVLVTGILVAVSLAIDIIDIFRVILGYPRLLSAVPSTFRLWTWLAYYFLGGLLGKKQVLEYVCKHISVRANLLIFAVSLILVSIYQYNMGILYHNRYADLHIANIFSFIFVISFFLLFYRRSFSKKWTAVLKIAGGNVMGVYVLHTTIIAIFMRFLDLSASLLNLGMIIIVYLVSLASSILLGKIPLLKELVKL